MAHINNVPLIPIPPGATEEERLELFKRWTALQHAANPHMYRPDGSQRSTGALLLNLFRRGH